MREIELGDLSVVEKYQDKEEIMKANGEIQRVQVDITFGTVFKTTFYIFLALLIWTPLMWIIGATVGLGSFALLAAGVK